MKYGINTNLDDNELNMYNELFNYKFTNYNVEKLFFEIINLINISSSMKFSKLTLENYNNNLVSNIIDEIIVNVENNNITNDNIIEKSNNIIKKKVRFENSTNIRQNNNKDSKCCSVL
jgi:hypothetical protein